MRNIIILLLLSASLNAQQVYRVYLKNGTVEFKDFQAANKFANENFADSVKLVSVIKDETIINDSIYLSRKEKTITTLKSKGYSSLQNITVGATLTSAQLQAVAWISLWNTGAINPATNKIDSTLNYIK